MITEKECLSQISTAIKRFGSYSYLDKGPEETMDLNAIEKKMADMTGGQLADLFAVLRTKKYGEEFVSSMLVELQHREDLDALYLDVRVKDLF